MWIPELNFPTDNRHACSEDLVQRTTSIFDDTILSIVSENVCSHVVPKLKNGYIAIMGDFEF